MFLDYFAAEFLQAVGLGLGFGRMIDVERQL